MSTYLERYGHGSPTYAELWTDTESNERIDFVVNDLSGDPTMSCAIDRTEVERLRSELSAWLKRTA